MKHFVKQGQCVDSYAGGVVSRPHGETVHGSVPNDVFHFEFLYVDGSGAVGSDDSPEDSEIRSISVMIDGFKHSV